MVKDYWANELSISLVTMVNYWLCKKDTLILRLRTQLLTSFIHLILPKASKLVCVLPEFTSFKTFKREKDS